MKKINLIRNIILGLGCLLLTTSAFAQLSNGSIAPDWTMTDINGTSHHLYADLAAGKRVVIDVSAVWCAPCWSYHTSDALEDLYTQYGPTGTVDQTMAVYFIEGDENSLTCLQGVNSGCSGTPQGNWTTGVTLPQFLTCAAPAGNGNSVVTNYAIAYFPTVYTVCPDHTIYESGQLTTAAHYSYANSHCAPLSTTVNDVKAFSCTAPNITYCIGTVTPSCIIQNYGTANLTSCTVVVKLDGTTQQTVNWTGNLAMYATATINFNAITGISNGSHTLAVETSVPNGLADEGTSNNNITKTISVMTVGNPVPVSQNYTSTTFPPTGYDAVDVSADGYNWARSSTAGHTAAGSMYMEFYNISSGKIDDFMLPLADFTNTTATSLTFWMAHRRYSTSYSDKLEVDVSTNCGTSWTQKWMKSGATLATNATVLTTEYTAPVAGDWRQETVDLAAYNGMNNVMIRFRATSGYGNNCFVDDINLTGNITGFENPEFNTSIHLFPNPSNGNMFVTNAENSTIEIFDVLGKIVYSKAIVLSNEELDLSVLSDGSYVARITGKNNVTTKNIVIVK